jgi:hypothetical protein
MNPFRDESTFTVYGFSEEDLHSRQSRLHANTDLDGLVAAVTYICCFAHILHRALRSRATERNNRLDPPEPPTHTDLEPDSRRLRPNKEKLRWRAAAGPGGAGLGSWTAKLHCEAALCPAKPHILIGIFLSAISQEYGTNVCASFNKHKELRGLSN